MRHFISFQKLKGLFVEATGNKIDNSALAHQINHELMNTGYVMSQELFDRLKEQDEDYLNEVYNDLIKGIKEVVGTDGYEPIYRNFPQSVLAMSYTEFAINAIIHYWSFGTWRPEDAEYVNREFKIEPVEYKEVGLLTQGQFNNIFYNIIYSGGSISGFDKKVVDFFLDNDIADNIDLGKISFKETLAYVGKRLLDNKMLKTLPTRNATDVLRLWAAYSGGDEGLKENTKFKSPKSFQRKLLRETLNECFNLEDSFKTYREPWLRVLFYLNISTEKFKGTYPELYAFGNALRNDPKSLETFNAKVERMIRDEDKTIFKLLARRAGVFTRRLDHLTRVFGKSAIDAYVKLENLTFTNVAAAYNHFDGRDEEQSGRGAILASQSASQVVTYEALAPLDKKLVAYIKKVLLEKLKNYTPFDEKRKVYIDRSLYYTPLAMNNRASTLSLDSKAIGETVKYTGNKTLRMYVHWEGRSDIDLSGFIITNDNEVQKIGWNARHKSTNFVLYSGDNTGYADKNAEYLDINISNAPKNAEWVIVEARIFSSRPSTFSGYNGKAHIGWMEVKHPEANEHWQPKTLQNAKVLTNKARNAYLMAYHVPTQNIVYLDMAMGSSAVSNSDDALKMRMFLESFVGLDDGQDISWDRLYQGHLLELRCSNVVEDKKEADVVFDDRTSADKILRALTFA